MTPGLKPMPHPFAASFVVAFAAAVMTNAFGLRMSVFALNLFKIFKPSLTSIAIKAAFAWSSSFKESMRTMSFGLYPCVRSSSCQWPDLHVSVGGSGGDACHDDEAEAAHDDEAEAACH